VKKIPNVWDRDTTLDERGKHGERERDRIIIYYISPISLAFGLACSSKMTIIFYGVHILIQISTKGS
jgi:hypothetical protein